MGDSYKGLEVNVGELGQRLNETEKYDQYLNVEMGYMNKEIVDLRNRVSSIGYGNAGTGQKDA
jgi:hypothetical protein